MNIKKNIGNILLTLFWLVLGTGVLVLLVAAMNIKAHKRCKKMEIDISGVRHFLFLNRKDVENIVTDGGISHPEGKAIRDFDLHRLEGILEKNVWVKDAELFFDNNQVLHIKLLEREPVARIFSKNGTSFYIDSSGFRMPLSNKLTVKLPVFTGFPVQRLRLRGADSVLMKHIKGISQFIREDKFWMAQIAQVDITPSYTFEMIPVVGNHIIEFGNGENYESKFRRLFVFYRQVLSQAGLTLYNRVNVEFDQQVVGKKGGVAKIDSLRAMKNIRKMIDNARKAAEDSMMINAGKAEDDTKQIPPSAVGDRGKHQKARLTKRNP